MFVRDLLKTKEPVYKFIHNTSFAASSNPPLPPAIRVFLGLNYVFKEDVDLVHVVVSSSLNEEDFKLAKKAAKVRNLSFC